MYKMSQGCTSRPTFSSVALRVELAPTDDSSVLQQVEIWNTETFCETPINK